MKLIFLILLFSNLLIAQYSLISDINYANRGDTAQVLDLLMPDNIVEASPLVVFIHGGQWRGGDKSLAIEWVDTLLNHKIIVASINYRLISDSIFPAQIYDCKAAIRWLKANASFYKIDTNKVAVMGTSAGGHLSALMGTSFGVVPLEDFNLGNPNYSSKVYAVVDFFGPTEMLRNDLYHSPNCSNPINFNEADSPPSKLVGCPIQTCSEKIIAVDPATYIDSSDPPFLIFHGEDDCSISAFESIYLDSALTAHNVYSSFNLMPGFAHAKDEQWKTPSLKLAVLSFLEQAFSGALCCDSSTTNILAEYLFPSFPNPFNDHVTIRYQLSSFKFVSLKIYDVLGREIANPVNTYQATGIYDQQFNANNLSSGVYYYQLRAGTFVETKKMILLH